MERIDAWWRENRTLAPDLFASELRFVVSLLEATPKLGVAYEPYVEKGIRRLLLPRTKHHLYRREKAEEVEVVTVWSAVRERGPRI